MHLNNAWKPSRACSNSSQNTFHQVKIPPPSIDNTFIETGIITTITTSHNISVTSNVLKHSDILMETESGPKNFATMTNGYSDVVEGRGTKKLSPRRDTFTPMSVPASSSLPTGYGRRSKGDEAGSTSKTSFPPPKVVRFEQTEEYHMSGPKIKLAPRPQWDLPKAEAKIPETVASMKAPPHEHDAKGVSITENLWQQMCDDYEPLIRTNRDLRLKIEEDRCEFEAVVRSQPDEKALKEKLVELDRRNSDQANYITKLEDEVKNLKIKLSRSQEQPQSIYERKVEEYQEKLDEAKAKATKLEARVQLMGARSRTFGFR
jgi:hypothetical protein